MHARVSRFTGSSGDTEGADLAAIREGLLRQLGEIDGFRGLISLEGEAGGGSMAITFWEDAASMVASRSAADAMRSRAADEAGGTIADVNEYEVSLLELKS